MGTPLEMLKRHLDVGLGNQPWVGGLDKMTSRGPFQPSSDSVASWVFHCLLVYKVLEQFVVQRRYSPE